ncbi:(2Fe-2S)-binding protein [Primorskyibacter sp. S87]|uniref:(2Fe-2S)-binding protein n=1 Tax=Primorskyibacter sp. S87 TaxID=3415126 RepID=UPI003C7C2C24
MSIDSRFLRLPERPGEPLGSDLRLTVDGETVVAREGDSLAAALLAHSGSASRLTPRENAPRTAYCMMGICFDCMVEVDGRKNVQACITPVRDGMVVRRQRGLPGQESLDD